jgi:CheY-like chemotaxis protein
MALHEIVHRARLVRELGDVPPVEANEARLGQVFLNLLVNAAQSIPEGACAKNEVRVTASTDSEGFAVVEVSDTGTGIPSEILPRIFDPFFTSKAMGQGTGLGLSISLGTIKSLGGTIEAESRLGHGSSFRVRLPPANGWRMSRPPALAASPAAEKIRLLVIDDDPLVGEAIARTASSDAEVEVLTDAREAVLRLANGERWNLVLCDLMMPETSGMDLYREALARAPDAVRSIVFMTAGAFTPRARAFLESVGRRYLEKPLDSDALRELLRSSAHAAVER